MEKLQIGTFQNFFRGCRYSFISLRAERKVFVGNDKNIWTFLPAKVSGVKLHCCQTIYLFGLQTIRNVAITTRPL